ncbi:hypothetical protein C2845_PM05G04210 [Panicum miliaceum]|uniref:Uncharacterized protein n=1 Tax=Panicum miliaceum TaxID=4540 RepID=A0A3L6SYF0_PANMI|nr:hypothetical protein C2845_PM05G04210 [Panicum miliaceum]
MCRHLTLLGEGAVLPPPPLARAVRCNPLGGEWRFSPQCARRPSPHARHRRTEPARCHVEPAWAPPPDAMARTRAAMRAPPHASRSRLVHTARLRPFLERGGGACRRPPGQAAVDAGPEWNAGGGSKQLGRPALLSLAKSGAAGRREVLESGNAAVLLRHVAAVRALLLFSLDGDDTRVGLVADGTVDMLSDAVAALATMALTSLATVDINKSPSGRTPSGIPELVGLLGRGGPRERREATTALYELCKLPENRCRAVREGAAPALADFAAVGSARAV